MAMTNEHPRCGYKRDPRSHRPPCILPAGHTGEHSYYGAIQPHAAVLVDYDAEDYVPTPRPLKVSKEEVLAARTANGGYTRATLAQWGVPWPPPKGWMKALTS